MSYCFWFLLLVYGSVSVNKSKVRYVDIFSSDVFCFVSEKITSYENNFLVHKTFFKMKETFVFT